MNKAKAAVTVAFVANGVIAGTFMSRVPDFKELLAVSNGKFGLALFFSSLGVLIGLGPSGRWSARKGSRTIAIPASLALGAAVIIVGFTKNYFQFTAALVLFGFTLAVQDIAMNAHAIAVEHEFKAKYMSFFHAMFSLGGLAGAFIGGIFSQLEIPIWQNAIFIAFFVVTTTYLLRNWWLPAEIDIHPIAQRKRKGRPGIFWILGLIGLCGQVGEGAAGDWGGILSRETFNASPFISAVPYVLFSATMVIGRLLGDRIRMKFGARRLLLTCGLIAGLGLIFGLTIGGIGGVIIGWSALGAGLSITIPILFATSGEIARNSYSGKIAPSEGVAMVSGIAYFGFMAGPPLIGFLANKFSLRTAMYLPAILALILACGAYSVLKNFSSEN